MDRYSKSQGAAGGGHRRVRSSQPAEVMRSAAKERGPPTKACVRETLSTVVDTPKVCKMMTLHNLMSEPLATLA